MKKIILIVIGMMMLNAADCYSKTFAFLFADDQVIKLDTETDTIANTTRSAEGIRGSKDLRGASCAVDVVNNYWITSSLSSGQAGFYVYELSTLKKVKFVLLPPDVKKPVDMKIIYPQQTSRFYVAVEDESLNNDAGGTVTMAFDKKTQAYLGITNNAVTDLVDENFWMSEDQSQIYVESAEGNMRIYSSQTLSLITSIDLSSKYSSGVWGKGIQDIKNGVALLGENNKLRDSDNNISFLTYNIATSAMTPKAVTGMSYKDYLLTPDGKKVVFSEEQNTVSSSDKASIKGYTATGRLHIYDVLTGRKIGMVTLTGGFGEKILGIRPQADKLYYLNYSKDESTITLYVINLLTFKVLKEIAVPNLNFMVFFNE